jgi:hypothetical protein
MWRNKAYIALGAVANYIPDVTYQHLLFGTHQLVRTMLCQVSEVGQPFSSLWFATAATVALVSCVTAFVGRNGCGISEWRVYTSVKSSFTDAWAVILGVSVSAMPRTLSLHLLSLAWVTFSLPFNAASQTFLTTFLIHAGYHPPIRTTDQMLDSGMKFSYAPEYRFILEENKDSNATNILKNSVDFVPVHDCFIWVLRHKNVSILSDFLSFQGQYDVGNLTDENSKPLFSQIEDWSTKRSGYAMIMLHGSPLMCRVDGIIRHVLEAGLYLKWLETHRHADKLTARSIAISRPVDEYYSFSLHHMQPAFYLLLMGYGLSVTCFVVEWALKLRTVSLKKR